MKKKLQLLMIALVTLVLVVGCSTPDQETLEDGVALEPEETVLAEATDSVAEEEITANKFPDFELKTLAEEDISQEVFLDYELTLVNIWGTTCAPCIREMPELQKLQTNYEDKGFNVMGFVTDGNHLAAKEITDALLVTYDQVIPDEAFGRGYLSEFQFIPTTLFVNKEGIIIGEPMVGAYDYETFEEKVKEYLEIE